jgi:hypothetical protein
LPCLCCHVDCSLQLVAGNDVDGIEMLVMWFVGVKVRCSSWRRFCTNLYTNFVSSDVSFLSCVADVPISTPLIFKCCRISTGCYIEEYILFTPNVVSNKYVIPLTWA